MPFRFLNNVGLGLAVLVFSFGCSDDNSQDGIMDNSSLDNDLPIVKDEDPKVDDKSCTEGEVYKDTNVEYQCIDSEWVLISGEKPSDNPDNNLSNGELLTQELMHDGETREYLLYMPSSYDGKSKQPLVLNFHGYGGSMNSHLMAADMRVVADSSGFILVYPQGTLIDGYSHWNASLPSETNKSSADDFGFVSALIEKLGQNYEVDLNKVYATGYSNGGFMSYGLACHLGDKIAAVAGVSGTMIDIEQCAPQHKTAVMHLHGTSDGVVPYAGGNGFSSVEETIDYWADFNGLSDEPLLTNIDEGGLSIEHYSYSGEAGVATVEHYKIIGGDHVWFDLDINGVHTNELIWKFLSRWSIAH